MPQPVQRVLIPLDAGERAGPLLDLVQRFDLPEGAEVRLLHVVPEGASRARIRAAWEHLARKASGARGPRPSHTVLVGDPARQIVECAVAGDASLIVLRSRAAGGPPAWTRGSVAERVVQESPVPVLLLSSGRDREVGPLRRILVPVEGPPRDPGRAASSASGRRSASSASGRRSASSASGRRSASSASDRRSASSASDRRSASSDSDRRSASSASDRRSASSDSDDRRSALAVLRLVAALARRQEAVVQLLAVVEPSRGGVGLVARRARAEAYLEELHGSLGGVAALRRVVTGSPDVEVTRNLADEDLLAVPVRRDVPGPIGDALLRRCPCALLMVPVG